MSNRTNDIPLDANNGSKTIDLFYKRELFRKEAYNDELESLGCLRDFNLYENNLYGRVDGAYAPRNPKTEMMTTLGDSHLVFNFVAEAFRSFEIDILDKKTKGLFAPDFNYVNSLQVVPKYLDSDVLFRINFREITDKILKSIKGGTRYHKHMVNYRAYLKNVFFPLLKQSLPEYAITFSSFMIGSQISLLSTGLTVDIAGLDASSDKVKIDNFISKGGFNHYLKAAMDANFYVDKNVPWRLVYRIGGTAPELKSYFHGYTSPSHKSDINILQNLSIDIYNKFVNQRKYVMVDSSIGKNCQRRVPLSLVGNDTIDQQTSLQYWISEYIRIKNIEANSFYTESEIDIIINRFDRAITEITMPTILRKINEYFNYPESSVGSFNAAIIRKRFVELGKSLDNFPEYVKLVVKQNTFTYY